MVREFTIPGVVDTTSEGIPDRPEWVARVDPPLPDGATVALELWRPLGDAPALEAARAAPWLEPLGVVRSSGVLAFRRPPAGSAGSWRRPVSRWRARRRLCAPGAGPYPASR